MSGNKRIEQIRLVRNWGDYPAGTLLAPAAQLARALVDAGIAIKVDTACEAVVKKPRTARTARMNRGKRDET